MCKRGRRRLLPTQINTASEKYQRLFTCVRACVCNVPQHIWDNCGRQFSLTTRWDLKSNSGLSNSGQQAPLSTEPALQPPGA
ncbi:hypothetical protein I79_000812 [Cricetulus griseus]|uniref:Uncharacterized protein n=1 Tax=Cricetulus griseus TaxID=10029 RepID=G3GT39_CRIGR|nr:hypothetical protein I79_000812 [Cricetulus griseus]